MSRERHTTRLQPIFRLANSAVLAISTVAVFTFVSLGPDLVFPLNVSLCCYALCIPLAAVQTLLLTIALNETVAEGVQNPFSFRAHARLVATSMSIFYIGTVALFAYLSLTASIVFAIGTSVGYGLLIFTLYPKENSRKMFVLWGGAVLALSAFILGVGFLLRHQLGIL